MNSRHLARIDSAETTARDAIEASRVHDANWRAAFDHDPPRITQSRDLGRWKAAWLWIVTAAGFVAFAGVCWVVSRLFGVQL